MVNFIKFKIDCFICLLEETNEAVQGMFKNPNWIKNNMENKYSFVIDNHLIIQDARCCLKEISIPMSLALFYNLPGSLYLEKLHLNYEK